MFFEQDWKTRLRQAISLAWEVFSYKAGNGLVPIYKEASMQLQYACILKETLALIKWSRNENFSLDLEKTLSDGERMRETDVFLFGEVDGQVHRIAIELKCYRTLAASGRPSGADDVFMKEVYFDLYLLERYCVAGSADQGVSLVMTDYQNQVYPTGRRDAGWPYFISEGATSPPNRPLKMTIGRKEVETHLVKGYQFRWKQIRSFWFAELEGETQRGEYA